MVTVCIPKLWMRVASVTFQKKGGVIFLEYISILLFFEIKLILYEIVTNWNKLPFSKLPVDLVYIFQCSDA